MHLPVGAIVNAAAILLGGALGLGFRHLLPERTSQTIIQVLGVFTGTIGVKMVLSGKEDLLVLICLVIGGFIGEFLQIEHWLERVGNLTNRWTPDGGISPAKGFVSTTLIFCVGSMAIVGSLTEGINGDPMILFTKSTIDGIASIAFAATLGYGVLFSAVSILLYQGGLTLLAGSLQPLLAGPVIQEVSAAGGYLLILLSLNILEIKKIRVANLLPALVVVGAAMLLKARGLF